MLKIFCCGDVVNKQGNDFLDSSLKKIIQKANISVANFEAPIVTTDSSKFPKAGPSLKQSQKSVEILAKSGFNLLSLANNHIYDYGESALKKTIHEIKKNKITTIGAGLSFEECYSFEICNKNEIKIGFLAAAENGFGCLDEKEKKSGYAWLFHPKFEDNISKLKKKVDYIIAILHAGLEDINIPIKEWRERYKRLCNLGVNIIIGHHPHVPQGYEKYNDSLIFYSLGNFYFDSFENDDSYSVLLKLQKKKINFEIIYHKKIEGKLKKVDKEQVNFSIDDLNNLLKNNYLKYNDKVCLDMFDKYFFNYYKIAMNQVANDYSYWQKIKHLLKRILLKNRGKKQRNLFLLHNLKIESQRYVSQRALELKINK